MAEDLEQKYWLELYDQFSDMAKALFKQEPFITYIYDNYFEEHEDDYTLELVIGNQPESVEVNSNKPTLHKEVYKKMIIALGQLFKNKWPSASFEIVDDPESEPTNNLFIKDLNIKVNKNDIAKK